jgi:poly-gamma-glutamate system protein
MAIGGALAVELLQVKVKQDYYRPKRRAALLMEKGMSHLRDLRQSVGVPIDEENDPSGSGLIGLPFSRLTSSIGNLEAKQRTVNPNFAAVAVQLLKKAGVEEGDVIAIGYSGSFPALNLAVLCAADALKLEPIIIASAASSEWGANIPGFTWLEMEGYLNKVGFTSFSSSAASLGGRGDKARGMSKGSVAILREIIDARKIPFLIAHGKQERIDQRMAFYEEAADDRPIKAYINVGRGFASVGAAVGMRVFKPGLNTRLPAGSHAVTSVMVEFASQDVPVIHFAHVTALCEKYGLLTEILESPPVGEGNIFFNMEYNLFLVGGVLLFLLVCLWFLVRLNLGHRFAARAAQKGGELPEPMV